MAKFKVGDRVRVVKNYDAAKPYLNRIGVIYDTINVGYLLQISGIKLSIYFTDEMLELVEPKEVQEKEVYIITNIKTGGSTQQIIFKDTLDYNEALQALDNMAKNGYKVEKLELVEPKEDKPYKKPLILTPYSRTDILVNGKVKKYSIEKVERPCNMPNEPERLQVTFIELTEKLPSQELPNQDPFNLNPHEFGNKVKISNAPYVLNEDGTIKFTGFSTEPLKKLDIPLPHELERQHRMINTLMWKQTPVLKESIDVLKKIQDYTDKELIKMLSKSFDDFYKNFDFSEPFAPFPYYHLSFDEALYTKPPKNRIPDRVVFNQDKGKVTVLISKHMDGVAPYWAYTSKVHGDDEYNGYFGFMLSYYKYLNRHLGGGTRKELIDMAFQHGDKIEFIIEGAVTQEVMKIAKIDEWDNILTALLETSKQSNGYWDYAEWKEMLRVHELETKREEQKAIRKEIKKHEHEIEKLKKKGV